MLRMARKESKAADAQSSKASGSEKRQPGTRKTIWREYFESAIHTAIMFVFFITFIGRTVGVPTGSMQNTINIGDHFLIDKFIFAPGSHPFFLPQREIRRGDIIVFKYPGDHDNPGRDKMSGVTPYTDYFIKRVIGLPGESIEIRGATVLINNQPLPEYRVPAEPGINGKAPLTILENPPRQSNEPYTVYYSPKTLAVSPDNPEKPPDIFHYGVEKPYVIPPGNYFVMGDNRDDSADSRAWGPVATELVIGRALFVFWSKDESKPPNNLLIDFFLHTRWGRTGTMIK
ncbi:MAG: signal peptidase [Acidobacteriota bacterium]|jgi:signal peptidase I|nr:signal peptidase [Acidobacteriota bacterium]